MSNIIIIMEDFNLNISSGEQQCHEFCYHLPSPLALNGEWKATLVDLKTPKIKNIVGTKILILNGRQWTTYEIPDGYFLNIGELNITFRTLSVPITLTQRGNQMIATLKNVDAIRIEGTLASVLGVEESTILRNLDDIDIDLNRPTRMIIVECDVIEPEYIGQQKRCILALGVPKKLKCPTTLHHLKFSIKNFHGDYLSFHRGEVYLALAFNKG